MKQIILTVLLLALCASAGAVTKEERQEAVVADGRYLAVSDVKLTQKGGSPMDRLETKYEIVTTKISPNDPSVVFEDAWYLRVLPNDSAYWYARSPLAMDEIPFLAALRSKMVERGIKGYARKYGVLGDAEWAEVVRYVPASDTTKLTTTVVRAERIGTAWTFTPVE